MKKFLVFFAIVAVTTASNINLNELCSGILFATLPHPTDQNLFIGCIQGKGTIFGCSQPDEVFDQFLVACVSDETPSNPEHNKLCEDVVFGWFPHEEFCDLYIVCEFSRPHIRTCPDNSIFNPYLPGCVPGDRETCQFENNSTPEPSTSTSTETSTEPTTTSTEATTTSTDPTTTSTESTTTTTDATSSPASSTSPFSTTTRDPSGDVNVSFVCPPSGFGNIPHMTDCSRYFECILGVRDVRNCPNNQIFDIITSQCGDRSTSLCGNNIRCV